MNKNYLKILWYLKLEIVIKINGIRKLRHKLSMHKKRVVNWLTYINYLLKDNEWKIYGWKWRSIIYYNIVFKRMFEYKIFL